jgi:hypothetical protein
MAVTVKNSKTGILSTFTDVEWASVQSKKEWHGVFSVVDGGAAKKNVPKEVVDLEASKAKATVNDLEPAPEVTEDKKKAEAADKKPNTGTK